VKSHQPTPDQSLNLFISSANSNFYDREDQDFLKSSWMNIGLKKMRRAEQAQKVKVREEEYQEQKEEIAQIMKQTKQNGQGLIMRERRWYNRRARRIVQTSEV
jgi:hypothetical protein